MENYNKLTTEAKEQFISIILEELEFSCSKNESLVVNYSDNLQDLHHKCFNEDYFIVGYYEASKFIDANFNSTFQAIDIVKEYEIDHFGEFTTQINSESICNMLAYIIGEEIIYSIDEDLKLDEVIEYLKTL